MRRSVVLVAALAILGLLVASQPAGASHAWGPYHWARTANPFTLKVVDSVTSQWDGHLDVAISDWAQSSVLNLTEEQGTESSQSRRKCNPVSGKIRVCNQTYGFNGWLGIAQIWLTTGSHIAQGITKLNDSYFNTSTYNTPAWRQFVTCQEIGHDFGLDHQDTNFDNPNLGTCMDYTNNPSTNQHPNQHDYDMLAQIYSHTDSFNSYSLATEAPETSMVADINADGSGTVIWILWADPRMGGPAPTAE